MLRNPRIGVALLALAGALWIASTALSRKSAVRAVREYHSIASASFKHYPMIHT